MRGKESRRDDLALEERTAVPTTRTGCFHAAYRSGYWNLMPTAATAFPSTTWLDLHAAQYGLGAAASNAARRPVGDSNHKAVVLPELG